MGLYFIRFVFFVLSLDPNAFFIPASPLHQLIPFDSNSTVPFFIPRRFLPYYTPLASTFHLRTLLLHTTSDTTYYT
ncbi:hypothetical protein M422DRAFT_37765 [Sphaerobolus stellatus SS14]|uniref:Secreted protein n=1 Tax=Sphaerobolus stellatus (strain SS14) TaxID=990650 RepID=A0A0C9UQ59_SPHS4|nr:hypothetical protein M422DRAFT_37765 [Sphaerobolus stellatus SS14]